MAETIDMSEVRTKLMNVSIADDPGDLLKRFCRFLSPRVNDGLKPSGFVIVCNFAIDDLIDGVDMHTHQIIKSNLVGYPLVVYSLMRMKITDIAREVFPPKYADEVVARYNRWKHL